MKLTVNAFLLGSALALCAVDSMAATVTAVRSWRAPDNTRLVLDLSEKVRYRQLSATAKQIVIELSDTDVAVSTLNLPTKVGLVQNVQFQRDGNKQLLIITVSADVKPHIFDLPANEQYSPRLVIDLFDKVTLQPIETPDEDTVASGDNQGRPVIVVVDAGHGGEDSGAIGANGHYEKYVTLAIARKLVAALRKTTGFKAYLTRDDDYFIPLQERRKIARHRYKADIFISIHADAALSPHAKGASVFALSRKGAHTATSRFAQALADKENKSDLIGGVDSSASRDSQLTNILADMVVEGSMTHSLHMGGLILGELGDLGKLHSRHVEQAGFAVLKEPGMISVLVETGFITNPDEESRLTSPEGQQRIASSVVNGVTRFMHKYPLPQTYFAWGKEQRASKQKNNALRAVVTAPDIKPFVPSADKLVGNPVLVNTVERVKPVVQESKKEEAPKIIVPTVVPDPMATLINQPVVTEKVDTTAKPESTVVIESRPLSAQPLPAAKDDKKDDKKATTKSDVSRRDSATPTAPKPTVTATLPTSLDEFMAGVPKVTTKTSATKPTETKPTDKVAPQTNNTKTESKPEAKKVAKVSKHTVEAGDSLSSIAAQYHISVDDLKAWNTLKHDTAMLGVTLRVTAPTTPAAKTKDNKAVTDHNDKTDSKAKPKTHKVKAGDSLSGIAAKYGVSAQTLREVNKLKDDNVLLDSTLKIPTP